MTRHCERGGKETEEQAYYISSAPLSAKRFAELIRGHGSIENSLHWSLDVVFGEDAAMLHTSHAPENFSVVRKIAKALLQNEKTFKGSAPRKSKRASYMPDYARLVIGFPVSDFK